MSAAATATALLAENAGIGADRLHRSREAGRLVHRCSEHTLVVLNGHTNTLHTHQADLKRHMSGLVLCN
ncbi:hypothetical protein LSTR_LSTR008516 [Laodelphax striatellus]|uniref:Uncharacterized protein n=1 Tax=Laodelphax striatellus TaxID=195883 RepID=A0A482WRN9_LAOST|nr:hypothetical protein LSTR_LSTR008516 [Laodelphax striatellus]